eukprot:1150046-Pelagomonas_calceolata.AAC.7
MLPQISPLEWDEAADTSSTDTFTTSIPGMECVHTSNNAHPCNGKWQPTPAAAAPTRSQPSSLKWNVARGN